MPNDQGSKPPAIDNTNAPLDVIEPVSPSRTPHKGQFQPGQSGNPNGRPPKIYNQSSILVTDLLEESAVEITQAAIAEAKKGNALAIKLCLDRLSPPPQTRPVRLTLPTAKPADAPSTTLLADHSAILTAVAEGAITPQEGESVSAIVEARRRSWESTIVAKRMDTLEDSVEAIRRNGTRRPHIRHVSSDAPSGKKEDPKS
jgi:Family of unknown function (DUF5681)